ncbi:MAG: CRISPR system precrRNA processing endoribonuclease RAMP protein Cas6 [Candidatus Helarchaeota archaeon]
MLSITFNLVKDDLIHGRPDRVRAYIFRGVFMKMLADIDNTLIEYLHRPNEIRPYSIKLKYYRNEIQFTVNIFHENLSNELLKFILSKKNQELNVGGSNYLIKNVNVELIDFSSFLKSSNSIVKFKLKFLTPTYFQKKNSSITVRFPYPVSLFTNLTHLWNELTPNDCHIDFKDFYDWIDKNLFLTSYNLRTRTIDIGKESRPVGFVGWATFINTDPENGFSNWLDTLCKFGEYTNLGGNRTSGCGSIEYIKYEILEVEESATNSPVSSK